MCLEWGSFPLCQKSSSWMTCELWGAFKPPLPDLSSPHMSHSHPTRAFLCRDLFDRLPRITRFKTLQSAAAVSACPWLTEARSPAWTDVAGWAGSEVGGKLSQHRAVSQTRVASGLVPFNGIGGTEWGCHNTGEQTGAEMVWLKWNETSLAGEADVLLLSGPERGETSVAKTDFKDVINAL